MRRYHTFTPVRNVIPNAESLSESLERWRPKTSNRKGSETKEPDMNTDTDDRVSFTLKTSSGVLSYRPSDYENYTDFLRVVIEMTLAFNSPEVDPEFKKVIRKAIDAYENNEHFEHEDDDDDEEDFDFVQSAIDDAKEQAQKMEDASNLVSNLPKTDNLRLHILSTDEGGTSHIEKILSKHTDLPPNELHEILHNHKPFTLPYEKAANLYIQLRMLDCTLSIKPVESGSGKGTTKKSAAKVSQNNTKSRKTTLKKNSKTFKVTGLEKLNHTDGIIKS